jgi:hypothetical protein
MCFNSRIGSFLPPLFFDGTRLPYTDTFKYLGMVCGRQINLNFATIHGWYFQKGGKRRTQIV